MQVTSRGMASASQADYGGSDSRHLLHQTERNKPLGYFLTGVGGWKKYFYYININIFNTASAIKSVTVLLKWMTDLSLRSVIQVLLKNDILGLTDRVKNGGVDPDAAYVW